MIDLTFTPASHVLQAGQIMEHSFCVSATRQRFEKYTSAKITWADGSVTPWTELQNYRSAPSSNCKKIAYPVPVGAPEGEAIFKVEYEWQDRDTEEYDSSIESQRYWIGPNPVPKITISPTVVGWGQGVQAKVEYFTPGAEAHLKVSVGGKLITSTYGYANENWLAELTVALLNRWSSLIDYTGSGLATATAPGYDPVSKSISIKKAFYWLTIEPYAGETVTLVETYKNYGIYYCSGPGVYGIKDPYGNENEFTGSVAGARTVIDNKPPILTADIKINGKCVGGYPNPSMLLEIYIDGEKFSERTIESDSLLIGQAYLLEVNMPAPGSHVSYGRMILTSPFGSYEYSTPENTYTL